MSGLWDENGGFIKQKLTMRVLFLLLALMMAVPYVSSAQTFVSVRNYRRSPIHLDVVRTWIKSIDPGKWDETCVELKILVRTTDKIDSFSFRVGPRGRHADTFVKMSVPTSGDSITHCVANDRTRNEKEFVLRLDFVENSKGTVWQSRHHQKEVRKFLRVWTPVNPS